MVAAVLGNLLEVFDFVAYGIFAVPIGRAFFPAHDPYVSLLLSVSAFGIGFLTRPLGALLVGLLADRRGRRAGMIASLALMGLGSLMIAVLPPFRVIGLAAPVLLVLARLVQGLAWGAEAGPATVFLIENAPPGRAGLYASWQSASQMLAVLAAGLVGVLSARLLGDAAMGAWGWRIPFLLGVLVVPVGLALRRGLHEIPLPARTAAGEAGGLLSAGPFRLLCGTMLVIGGTVSQYFINYVSTYALSVLHLPASAALLGSVAAGVSGTAAALCGGLWSDRGGRIAPVVLPRLLLAVGILPMLLSLHDHPGVEAFVLVTVAVTVLQVGSFAASLLLLAELFPASVRATGFGLLYAAAISVFGGTAQIVFTWLIHRTGDPASPAWYLAAVNLLCGAAGLGLMRGGRRRSLQGDVSLLPTAPKIGGGREG